MEGKFELLVTTLDLPFVGSIDLVAEIKSHTTVVDFNTAGRDYKDYEAPLVEVMERALSDQLTAYSLAEPEAEQVALCVLVKTKEPFVEWHFVGESENDMAEYLSKGRLVSEDIAAARSYKGPGKECAYCDF